MTNDQASELLGKMRTAWPSINLEQPRYLDWHAELANWDHDYVRDLLRDRKTRDPHHPPTFDELVDLLHDRMLRISPRQQAVNRAGIAHVRQILEARHPRPEQETA